MTPLFTGRVAVVTGGARGIGRALAEALAARGADIALLDLLDTAEAQAHLGTQAQGRVRGYGVDVTSPDSVAHALDAVEAELGTASVLVNCAGISMQIPALDTSLTSWQRIMDVNLNGTFVTNTEFARRAVAAGISASIVNVSSMSAFVVNVPQNQAAYNTSKAAVSMLTKSLAIEWLPQGVRVNAIAPGYISSDMTRDFVEQNRELADEWIRRIPAQRMGTPEELGELVVYLASERSRYIVGQSIIIDGGYSLL